MTPEERRELFHRRERLFTKITFELERAYEKHGSAPWSRHEFFGILKEEVDELWNAIKADALPEEVEGELVQVAAMCVRYFETMNRWKPGEV